MNRHKKIALILLLGLIFRLVIVFCLPVREFKDTIKRYHNTAVNLIEGRGYSHFGSAPYKPTILKPPVYSLFLAGIYKVFGVNHTVVKIIQIILDLLACFLLYLIARDYFTESAAIVIMALACFCPVTVVYTNLLNPESLTLFLMVLSLWLVSRAILYKKKAYFFLSGVSTILMGYCRPEFISFVFIFGSVVILLKKEEKLKFFLIYICGIIVIVSPWALRNYRLTGKFIPLASGDALGTSLYLGSLGHEADSVENLDKFFESNPEAKRLYTERYKNTLYNQSLDLNRDSEYERIFMNLAIKRISDDPIGYILTRLRGIPMVWINLHANEYVFLNTKKLRLLHPDFKQIFYYWGTQAREVIILAAKYVFFGVNIFYVAFAFIGLWVIRGRIKQLSFIIIPLVYAQVFFLFMHRSPNYTVPYWSCLIFLSGIGLYYIFIADHKERERINLCQD